MRAGLAAFDMPAQRRRSAALDRRHDLQLAEAHVAGVGRTPSRPAVAKDVRHLDRWPRQRPRSARHLQQNIERARHLAERVDGDAGVERRRVELFVSERTRAIMLTFYVIETESSAERDSMLAGGATLSARDTRPGPPP